MTLGAHGWPATAPAASGARHDTDRLLDRYRAARVQEALFDLRDGPGSGPSIGFDEFVDSDGSVRPAWHELADAIAERGRAGLDRLRSVVHTLVDNDGISYSEVAPGGSQGLEPRPWRLDTLPIVLSAADWETLEAGLVQRSRLLDAALADLYGPRRLLTEGLLPPELLFAHPGYVRAANGIEIPGHHQLFMHACDVSRLPDGSFRVNADWTQAPSGSGYALADRRVLAHAIPDLYERIAPRPTTPFAQALRLALIDAAPDDAQDPVVVVLSPGIYSETAFDQAYLATLLGFPLVESADLVVRDGKVWMRSLGTLKRVDVVFRRVDAVYTDPLDLRADSRLGVAGLVEAQHRGTVTVVNTLGSGILESPGLLRFLPELAGHLLGEDPLLDTAPVYWGGIAAERSHLLANLSSLLVKSTVGRKTLVGPTLSSQQLAELATRIEHAPWQWVGQEPPQFSSAPTDHAGALTSAGVGMRLFTVAQRSGYAPMIGGVGYVLASGPAAYTLSTVAAKDVWVRPTGRGRAEAVTLPAPTGTQPAKTGAGTWAVSSPRVLSDLFWIGRYGERAESMARLLIVARDRFHVYRHHQDTEESTCVPVLMAALGAITGTDDGGGDQAEMIAVAPSTLWSLTMDPDRPGSLVQSVEKLALAARAVRDQLSNDTWMVLAGVERALTHRAEPPDSMTEADPVLATAQSQTLAGMLTLSGVAAESMVRDAGWTMMDIGKRIERGLWLTALLQATLAVVRPAAAEQIIIEATLVACESSVIYRRRTAGAVSVAAMAELMLFDATNPRSLLHQVERLRVNLRDLPGSSGSSRPERLVDEITTLLRRSHPAELEQVSDDGRRAELGDLLSGIHTGLRDLAEAITATQLALPGHMQPLWGPDERRVMSA